MTRWRLLLRNTNHKLLIGAILVGLLTLSVVGAITYSLGWWPHKAIEPSRNAEVQGTSTSALDNNASISATVTDINQGQLLPLETPIATPTKTATSTSKPTTAPPNQSPTPAPATPTTQPAQTSQPQSSANNTQPSNQTSNDQVIEA